MFVAVISTTGQGDFPSTSRIFWQRLLIKRLSPKALAPVRFTVFGLGDSSYPKYNWAGLKLNKRLLQLGAQEFHSKGEGDEQHDGGTDAFFGPWISDLCLSVLARHPIPAGLDAIPESRLLAPKWLLSKSGHLLSGDFEAQCQKNGESKQARDSLRLSKDLQDAPESASSTLNTSSQVLQVVLSRNKRVTPADHWQDVRHMTFSSETHARYSPGDVLVVYPQNSIDAVNDLIDRMQWSNIIDAELFLEAQTESSSMRPTPPHIHLPPNTTLTLRNILIHSLDITAIPRRSFFSAAAHFTSNEYHKERLLEFTKPEYLDEYYDYATRPRRSILEVLQEFDSINIPWQWAINIFPPLRGRQFSIASGGQLKLDERGQARFELLVAIVKYRTVIKKIREGVCTKYLANLEPGTEMQVTLQAGGLGIAKDLERPMMLVGPGTGVAPVRSLIWERLLWMGDNKPALGTDTEDKLAHSNKGQEILLVFGCRNRESDYFFKTEWNHLRNKMPLQVYPAFSRDQKQKNYVQDRIREKSAHVFDLLHHRNGLIYVCGSSGKMPQAVRAALVFAYQKEGNIDERSARKCIEQLEKEGRYKQETW